MKKKRIKRMMIFSLIIIGTLEIGGAIPLFLQIVPPNGIYGFRTDKTLSDKKIWYQANEFEGKLIMVIGIFTLSFTGLLWRFRETMSAFTIQWLSISGVIFSILIMVIASFFYLRGI